LTVQGYEQLKAAEEARFKGIENELDRLNGMFSLLSGQLPSDRVTEIKDPSGILRFYPLGKEQAIAEDGMLYEQGAALLPITSEPCTEMS
jgi:hypothetical protein